MASGIVNLNKARKARAKLDKARLAAFNRDKFGRSKAEKELAAAEEALAAKKLDGVKREFEDAAGAAKVTNPDDGPGRA